MTDFDTLREWMVEQQIAARGVTDAKVLAAMREVPREEFVPAELTAQAYEDTPLPIGEGQTISQPYIVGFMIAALQCKGDERVLDIGTGSGYAAAVLSRIVAEVYTVERLAGLADLARRRLQRLHYDNIQVFHGDGSLGWAEHAPYDAIVVGAGGLKVPVTLRNQLAIHHGRLVMPVGASLHAQRLIREVRLSEDKFEHEKLSAVRFVPLIGAEGWPQDPD